MFVIRILMGLTAQLRLVKQLVFVFLIVLVETVGQILNVIFLVGLVMRHKPVMSLGRVLINHAKKEHHEHAL